MKKLRMIITVLCMMVMMFGVVPSASALTITPGNPKAEWTYDEITYNDKNPDATYISTLAGITLEELYKQDIGVSSDSGTFALSYKTTFSNTTEDPEDALIKWEGSSFPYISPTFDYTVYLLVKDGNHTPIWYIYNLDELGWNGQDDILLDGFWPEKGAISHVSMYGPTSVPEPTTLLLLGLGLIGVAGVGRKLRK